MKSYFLIFLFLVASVFIFPNKKIITSENKSKSLFVNNHFIVKLKSSDELLAPAGISSAKNDKEILEKISSRIGITVTGIKNLFPYDKHHFLDLAKKYEINKFYIISIAGKDDIIEICKKFENEKIVDYAEPDFIGEAGSKSSKYTLYMKPNDEYYNKQWALNNDGTVKTSTGHPGKKGADINVEKGWDIETGSQNIIVGILDSGVKLDHPDLAGRIWINTKESRNGKDNDGNGFIGDINGWNFAYGNNDVTDDGGHGTNIAGTIGAVANNYIGYAGIDQNCKLMICKDLDDENLGEYSWWAEALYYAANNGAKVINMSEGGYDYSKSLETAINYAYNAGCLILASMMNKNNNDTYYPAAFKNVMAIGATDTDDGRCRQFTWGGGSNWGKHISVVAPGNRIYGLDYKDDSNYDVYWSGTSQATAYVSGIASLLLAHDSSLTNAKLKEIICATAKDQVGDPREDTPGWDEYYGWGRVDLYAALTYESSPVKNYEPKKIEGADTKQEKLEPGKAKSDEPKSARSEDDDSKRAKKVEH